jgi:hypothetical protein
MAWSLMIWFDQIIGSGDVLRSKRSGPEQQSSSITGRYQRA